MRASVVAVGGVALLGGGIWIGWAAGGAVKSAPSPLPASESTAAPPPTAVAPPAADPAGPASRGPVEAWFHARPMPVVPGPTGEVFGSVRTESGEPMAGVEVVVQPRYPYEKQRAEAAAAGEGGDLASRLDVEALRLVWEEGTRRVAATDGTGAFRVAGVPDGGVIVTPRKDGWRFRPTAPSYGGSQEVCIGQRVDFTGFPVVEVRVEVRLPDGTEPQEAWVRTQREGRSIFVAWVPGCPVVPLPLGESEVFVDSGRWQVFRSDSRRIDLKPGTPEQVLRFDLRSSPAISGHLSFPGRQGPFRVLVCLLRSPPAGEAVTPAMLRMQGQSTPAVDARRWEFTFKDLSPGRYALAVFPEFSGEGPPLHMEEVAVGDSLVEREVAVPLPDRSRIVVVRLLDPAGRPVRAARVQVQYLEDGRYRAACDEAALAEDGTFLAPMTRASDASFDTSSTPFDPVKGIFRVTARTDAYGALGTDARASAVPEVELRFGEPASLSATVEGYEGSPWHGQIRASLDSPSGAAVQVSMPAPSSTFNAEGRAVFAAVQPGDYELNLVLEGGRNLRIPVARVPVAVGLGRSEIRIPFPPLYPVRFTGSGGRVDLGRIDNPRFRVYLDLPRLEGSFTLDGLPAGEYQADDRTGAPKKFTLPGTGEVKLGK